MHGLRCQLLCGDQNVSGCKSQLQPDRKFRHLPFPGKGGVGWSCGLATGLFAWVWGGAAELHRSSYSSMSRRTRRNLRAALSASDWLHA